MTKSYPDQCIERAEKARELCHKLIAGEDLGDGDYFRDIMLEVGEEEV